VDVSAGGLRASFPPVPSLHPGEDIRFELSLGGATPLTGPGPMRLSGQGTVLRVAPASSDREVAVRFAAPLTLLEGFPAISVF
jgi:hypothetical protein